MATSAVVQSFDDRFAKIGIEKMLWVSPNSTEGSETELKIIQ